MKLGSFRRATKHLPDETDLVMQKRVSGKWIIMAPVINLRLLKIPRIDVTRIVLVNDKEIEEAAEDESKHPFQRQTG